VKRWVESSIFRRTFCFVWMPEPGHSTMISSLASVLVAKAKATPEKVVPCIQRSANHAKRQEVRMDPYKVNADYELRFTPLVAFDLRHTVLICRVSTLLLRIVSVALLLLLHGIARWRRLLIQLLLMLRRICMSTASVDRRRRHGTVRPGLIRGGTEGVAIVGVLV